MKLTKQTVHLPIEHESIHWFIPQEGYFFTTEELNQLLSEVIKDSLSTAAENATLKDVNEDCHYEDEEGNFPEILMLNKQSITNTFEETFKKFKV